MQTNHLWGVSLVEMTIHSVSNLLPKRVQSVRFGKDGLTQSPRRKAAFRGFLDEEKDFAHTLQAKSVFQLARVSAIGGWLARILSAGVNASARSGHYLITGLGADAAWGAASLTE
jgi:hypothetical protein